MAQDVKADRGSDLRPLIRLCHRACLMALTPFPATPFAEHRLAAGAACRRLSEERLPFLRQHNMPRLAGFRLAHRDRSNVGVEVLDLEPDQLAVAAAGFERRLYQRPEVGIGRIDEPLGLGDGQVADTGGVDILERLDAAPFKVAGNLASRGRRS